MELKDNICYRQASFFLSEETNEVIGCLQQQEYEELTTEDFHLPFFSATKINLKRIYSTRSYRAVKATPLL